MLHVDRCVGWRFASEAILLRILHYSWWQLHRMLSNAISTSEFGSFYHRYFNTAIVEWRLSLHVILLLFNVVVACHSVILISVFACSSRVLCSSSLLWVSDTQLWTFEASVLIVFVSQVSDKLKVYSAQLCLGLLFALWRASFVNKESVYFSLCLVEVVLLLPPRVFKLLHRGNERVLVLALPLVPLLEWIVLSSDAIWLA